MKQIEGGVTAAKGYTTAGTRAGIKKGKTNKDMAMIFSEKPAVTAGTFTKNLVKAAPVLWDKKVTDAGVAQAVVINTGIANACTGQAGFEYFIRYGAGCIDRCHRIYIADGRDCRWCEEAFRYAEK